MLKFSIRDGKFVGKSSAPCLHTFSGIRKSGNYGLADRARQEHKELDVSTKKDEAIVPAPAVVVVDEELISRYSHLLDHPKKPEDFYVTAVARKHLVTKSTTVEVERETLPPIDSLMGQLKSIEKSQRMMLDWT